MTCIPNCDKNIGGPPFVVIICSIIYILVYILYSDEFRSGREPYLNNTIAFIPEYRSEVWRYITYQCDHLNLQHLIPNLVLFLMTGVPLELVHSSLRVFMIMN